MRCQYLSAITPPPPTLSKATGGTISTPNTWYFWLCTRTRAGFTTFSTVASITITSGEYISAVIPSTVRGVDTEATDVREVFVLANTTNSPATAKIVASVLGYHPVTGELSTLPATVTFNTNEKLELGKRVYHTDDLPVAGDLVHGMIREIESISENISEIRQYKAVKNGMDVAYAWVTLYPQTFTPYIANTLGVYGCDRDIAQITDPTIVTTSRFSGTGESNKLAIALVNNSAESVPQGRGIIITCDIDGVNVSSSMVGRIIFSVIGYVQLTTGTLDTSGLTIGGEYEYQGTREIFFLEKDLPTGWAIAFKCWLDYEPYAYDPFSSLLQGSKIGVYAAISPRRATYTPDELIGEYISFGKYIVPDGLGLYPIATLGTGRVAQFTFRNVPAEIVAGIQANTADQNVVITNNGTCYVASTVPSTAALRAIISTVNGTGAATGWSGAIAVTNSLRLQITLTNPVAIRDDYPDTKIAGLETGETNADTLVVYVRPNGGGTITKWEFAIANTSTPQTFQIGSIAGTAIGSSLPSVAADFGLFAPTLTSSSTVSGSSVFVSGNIQVAIAYKYNNTLTSVTHNETDGCIKELSGADVAATIYNSRFYKGFVLSYTTLRNLEADQVSTIHVRGVKRANYPFELWFYDPSSSASDNNSTVLEATNGTGAFHLVTGGGIETVASKTAIKALITTYLSEGKIVLCLENNALYRFDPTLPAADDNDIYLAATGLPTVGWIKVSGSGGGSGHIVNGLTAQPNLTFSNQFAVTNNPGASSTDVGLAVNAIALDRIVAITADRLLGRISTNGSISQIPLGTGLSFTGGALVCTATGTAATVGVGTVTTGNPGTSVIVTNVGTTSAAILDFTIPRGTNGTNGIDATTRTNNGFTVPSVSSNVSITLLSSASLSSGVVIYIEAAGYYSVSSITNSTTIVATNLGYSMNASPATNITTNKLVVTAGVKGADGTNGTNGTNGATGSVSAASALELVQQSTDPAAVLGKTLVYAKTDNKVYRRTPDGTITEVDTVEFPVIFAAPTTGTYTLLLSTIRGKTLNAIRVKTDGGTAIFNLKINSTNITGVSSITATTSKTAYNATAANVMVVDDDLKIEITSVSSAVNLSLLLIFS